MAQKRLDIASRVAIQRAPRIRLTNPNALSGVVNAAQSSAQAGQALQQIGNRIGAALAPHANAQAERAGTEAAQIPTFEKAAINHHLEMGGSGNAERDANGVVMPWIPDASSISIYDQSYRRAMLSRYGAEVEIGARDTIRGFFDRNLRNPKDLSAVGEAYIHGLVKDAPPGAKAQIRNVGRQLLAGYVDTAAKNRAAHDMKAANSALLNVVEVNSRELTNGIIAGEEFVTPKIDPETGEAKLTKNSIVEQRIVSIVNGITGLVRTGHMTESEVPAALNAQNKDIGASQFLKQIQWNGRNEAGGLSSLELTDSVLRGTATMTAFEIDEEGQVRYVQKSVGDVYTAEELSNLSKDLRDYSSNLQAVRLTKERLNNEYVSREFQRAVNNYLEEVQADGSGDVDALFKRIEQTTDPATKTAQLRTAMALKKHADSEAGQKDADTVTASNISAMVAVVNEDYTSIVAKMPNNVRDLWAIAALPPGEHFDLDQQLAAANSVMKWLSGSEESAAQKLKAKKAGRKDALNDADKEAKIKLAKERVAGLSVLEFRSMTPGEQEDIAQFVQKTMDGTTTAAAVRIAGHIERARKALNSGDTQEKKAAERQARRLPPAAGSHIVSGGHFERAMSRFIEIGRKGITDEQIEKNLDLIVREIKDNPHYKTGGLPLQIASYLTDALERASTGDEITMKTALTLWRVIQDSTELTRQTLGSTLMPTEITNAYNYIGKKFGSISGGADLNIWTDGLAISRGESEDNQINHSRDVEDSIYKKVLNRLDDTWWGQSLWYWADDPPGVSRQLMNIVINGVADKLSVANPSGDQIDRLAKQIIGEVTKKGRYTISTIMEASDNRSYQPNTPTGWWPGLDEQWFIAQSQKTLDKTSKYWAEKSHPTFSGIDLVLGENVFLKFLRLDVNGRPEYQYFYTANNTDWLSIPGVPDGEGGDLDSVFALGVNYSKEAEEELLRQAEGTRTPLAVGSRIKELSNQRLAELLSHPRISPAAKANIERVIINSRLFSPTLEESDPPRNPSEFANARSR